MVKKKPCLSDDSIEFGFRMYRWFIQSLMFLLTIMKQFLEKNRCVSERQQ